MRAGGDSFAPDSAIILTFEAAERWREKA